MKPPRHRLSLSYEQLVGVLNATVALGLAFHLGRELGSPRELAATDFTVFRTGWSLILDGRARVLYDAAAQDGVQRALLAQVGSLGFQDGMMAFLHPPHAALAGCALGWLARALGGTFAFWVWTACSVVILARLGSLVRDELGGGAGTALLVAVTLAAFYPVLETLQQGQVSALLAWAALACAVALRRRRALAAACWLLVLSIKPQTLPPFLVVLAARREWRVLATAAILGVAVALVTAACLGAHVWWDYLASLHGLERFFGVGTPDHMPTVRGLLSRLVGPGPEHRGFVDAVTGVAWVTALLAAAAVATRTRARAEADGALAFALAAGSLASPHLFPQDVLLWIAPVTLVLAGSRRADEETWRRQSRVVLAWPLWFVAARAFDIRETPTPRLLFDPMLPPLLLATVWAAREALRAAPTPVVTATVADLATAAAPRRA